MYEIIKCREQIIEKIKSLINYDDGCFIRVDYNDYNAILSKDTECRLIAIQGARCNILSEMSVALTECDVFDVKNAVVRVATNKSADLEYDDAIALLSAIKSKYEDVNFIWGLAYDNRLLDDETSVLILLG